MVEERTISMVGERTIALMITKIKDYQNMVIVIIFNFFLILYNYYYITIQICHKWPHIKVEFIFIKIKTYEFEYTSERLKYYF